MNGLSVKRLLVVILVLMALMLAGCVGDQVFVPWIGPGR